MLDWLFGSSESSTSVPSWIKEPAQEMLRRSVDMGRTGYMPWTGPVVAAFDPAQQGAMRNNAAMRSAFGMDATMPRIPQAQDFGGGMWGYSSMPLYDANMAELQRTRPGQMDFYNSYFVDPVTGVPGSRMNQGATDNRTAAQIAYDNGTSSTMHPLVTGDRTSIFYGGGGGAEPGDFARPTGGGGGLFGGYSGLGDMLDGGGPGQAGETFGGLLGGFSNAMGRTPGGGLRGRFF